MAHQRSFARLAVPVSAIVLAACAAVVTIKVLADDNAVAPRVLDQTALEQQVTKQAQLDGDGTGLTVTCPNAVPIVVGATFKCEIVKNGSPTAGATVSILTDQGELDISTA
ncbi:DUF4333 domain-containing protein [Kutzneria sp. NPDC052558]|uniref:DUF4333 domain-containing protein n=1 Tax=Kutzneria sp. NPDC052558 TaxID=3364121 RepID=UPI0037C9CD28